jgi:hypothetical protein
MALTASKFTNKKFIETERERDIMNEKNIPLDIVVFVCAAAMITIYRKKCKTSLIRLLFYNQPL